MAYINGNKILFSTKFVRTGDYQTGYEEGYAEGIAAAKPVNLFTNSDFSETVNITTGVGYQAPVPANWGVEETILQEQPSHNPSVENGEYRTGNLSYCDSYIGTIIHLRQTVQNPEHKRLYLLIDDTYMRAVTKAECPQCRDYSDEDFFPISFTAYIKAGGETVYSWNDGNVHKTIYVPIPESISNNNEIEFEIYLCAKGHDVVNCSIKNPCLIAIPS